MEYYLVVLLVYLGTDLLAAWGLNLEFGVAGVANLAFIVTIAAGSYTYAVCTLGPPAAMGNFQQYVGGFTLPFPVAVAAGTLMGAARRGAHRHHGAQASAPGLPGRGNAGRLADGGHRRQRRHRVSQRERRPRPDPFAPFSDQDPEIQRWGLVAIVAVCCVAGYLILRRFTDGPIGRALRAMRDDEYAAAAIGKDIVAMRLMVQAVGGGFGGLSGALLVAFIGGWSPGAWNYVETLALLTAVIVGGMGNNRGVTLGTFLIAILLLQGVQFLPQISFRIGLREDLGWIVLGMFTIVFIWVRPQGVLAEKRPKYGGSP